ncbi:MAG: hypothetical protein EA355_07495 [Rhodobacteraceae bacterium]|nr:MAG: hypothetical protein EA355_07495 [Paracoccaceae bacterium]
MIAQAPRPALPPLGHAHRLRTPRREFWLVLCHLFVVALALADDEVAEGLGALFGLSASGVALAETAITVFVLVAWAALTAAWVRCRRDA